MAGILQSAKEALGMGPKVRYAIVGLGDISQRSLLPSVKHTHNSEVVAVVTGDPEKAKKVCKEYNIKDSYSYEQFDVLLKSKTVDAIYLATPNWRHAEFAIPALRAGVHVLLEKPMEISSAKCQEILDAQKGTQAKLMIAYRLHFEPATISAISRVRVGELGQVHMFSSVFTQNCKPDNHRARNGAAAGPLLDMGVYPLNAVRNLYAAEPIEVSAVGIKHPEAGFSQDFDDTVAVTLIFPHNRIAQFIVSYYGNGIDEYTIVGTQGSIHVSPAFMYTSGLEFNPITVGEKHKHETFKHTDQFGGELKYFSDCILKGQDPEPDGEEGMLDVRVMDALLRALETKTPQKLEPYVRYKKITPNQEIDLRAVKQPSPSEEINAAPPAK